MSLTTQDREVRKLVRALCAYDTDKIDFLLTYLGYKRATEVLLGRVHWNGPDTKAEQKKNGAAFRKLCSAANMYALKSFNPNVGWKQMSWFITARTKEDALKLESLNPRGRSGQLTLGRMYGFPDTAARAYGRGQKYLVPFRSGIEVLPRAVITEDYMAFLDFRLSKKDWRSELKTVRAWADAIRAFDPELYRREVKEYRKRLTKK